MSTLLTATFKTALLNIPLKQRWSKMLFSKVLPIGALASLATAQDLLVRTHITSHGKDKGVNSIMTQARFSTYDGDIFDIEAEDCVNFQRSQQIYTDQNLHRSMILTNN